jgi:uncharacterized protein (TIGR02246 family)
VPPWEPLAARETHIKGDKMKTKTYSALLTVMFTAALGTAFAAGSEEQRIRDLDKQWSSAAGSKDAAKTATFYAPDGSMLPFNGPIVNGRSKIQEAWAGLMAKPGFAIHFEPTRIVVAKSHDVAFDVGTFELTMNDDHGQPAIVIGKYLVAWVKQKDGEWKAAADCFNTDK